MQAAAESRRLQRRSSDSVLSAWHRRRLGSGENVWVFFVYEDFPPAMLRAARQAVAQQQGVPAAAAAVGGSPLACSSSRQPPSLNALPVSPERPSAHMPALLLGGCSCHQQQYPLQAVVPLRAGGTADVEAPPGPCPAPPKVPVVVVQPDSRLGLVLKDPVEYPPNPSLPSPLVDGVSLAGSPGVPSAPSAARCRERDAEAASSARPSTPRPGAEAPPRPASSAGSALAASESDPSGEESDPSAEGEDLEAGLGPGGSTPRPGSGGPGPPTGGRAAAPELPGPPGAGVVRAQHWGRQGAPRLWHAPRPSHRGTG